MIKTKRIKSKLKGGTKPHLDDSKLDQVLELAYLMFKYPSKTQNQIIHNYIHESQEAKTQKNGGDSDDILKKKIGNVLFFIQDVMGYKFFEINKQKKQLKLNTKKLEAFLKILELESRPNPTVKNIINMIKFYLKSDKEGSKSSLNFPDVPTDTPLSTKWEDLQAAITQLEGLKLGLPIAPSGLQSVPSEVSSPREVSSTRTQRTALKKMGKKSSIKRKSSSSFKKRKRKSTIKRKRKSSSNKN